MKTDSITANSCNVFECPASYYNLATKRWDSGCFTLTKNHIQFVCDSDKDAQFHLCLPLSTITGLEKRQSNFIYPSLVISVASEKHWFGSFSNRDAVFNLLELFWRESLISKPHRKSSPPKVLSNTNSSLGKELLEILHESKNNLIDTANALSDQSQQLYEAEEAVEDLNSDLTKAEEVIKSLSLPLALVNLTNNNKDNVDINITPTHRFKVTFSFSNDQNKIDWEKGVLIISNNVISLKVEENTVMQVTKDELEVLQVLSPWELCINHTFSGVRRSCYFMCPQLSRLLKFVSSISHYQEKIAYLDDDSSVYDTASCSSFGSALNSPSSPSAHSKSSTQKIGLNQSQTSPDSSAISKKEIQELKETESESCDTQANNCALSEEEIQEINRVLQNLQTLAAEVGREQENQMERINTLVENTEKTEIRVKKDDESVKKKA